MWLSTVCVCVLEMWQTSVTVDLVCVRNVRDWCYCWLCVLEMWQNGVTVDCACVLEMWQIGVTVDFVC